MRGLLYDGALAVACLSALLVVSAHAHPGSGIVVDQKGQVRVVTIIEISPIGIIDSWRRYRSLGEDRSVPLLMMGNGTVLPPSVSGSVANLWACD
jgi:hypothetical protein